MALEIIPRIFFIGAEFSKIIQKDFIADYSGIGGEISAAAKKRIEMADYACIFSNQATIEDALKFDIYQKKILDYAISVNKKILIYSLNTGFFYELQLTTDKRSFKLKNVCYKSVNINLKETLKNETVEKNKTLEITTSSSVLPYKDRDCFSFAQKGEFLEQSSTHSFQFEVNSPSFNRNILLLI